MSFNENAQLDTSQVESGGGRGAGGGLGGGGGGFPGGIQVGGGIGGLILLVLALIFGGSQFLGGGGAGDPDAGSAGLPGQDLQLNQVRAAGQVDQGAFAQCRTGADANRNDVCLVVATVNSVQDYWNKTLPRYNTQYTMAPTVIYEGITASGCGTASAQVGPFYCPLDQKIYVDAAFFRDLQTNYGADGGQLAKEYVIGHEYGHHVQNILGILNRSQADPSGPNSGAVRIELMADCLAGTWVRSATSTTDAQGTPLMKPITEADINSALSAAAAVGDDRIQKASTGRVNPENWTHGSAQARQNWFMEGYRTGDINACNTFTPATVS